MNNNLLIVGAGIYGVVAKEIAESMKCFEKIAFVDDEIKSNSYVIEVVGTCADIGRLSCEYSNIIVAIGNPEVRLSLIQRIEDETNSRVVTLVSPKSYIFSSARIMKGSIVEPFAVVHAECLIGVGCIISAGAVVNHASICADGVHVDCNATVAGHTLVPAGTKVCSNTCFKKDTVSADDFAIKKSEPYGPIETEGLNVCFEDGM